ncbi:GPI biosynthesis protein Pig-F [Penicillium brevicompactum]|uniref:GPI biosynthesis protein Pig-F n=1 Tax=Penicillium brevicompactum TaxID=5074 RepID=A0A9W9QL53_PENBR|nr:GPI biosynthesis protein Pig-F [Penicillium brevicompactum]
MVTVGKSHGDPVHPLPTSSDPVTSSPPSRRDLASWWKQFKRSTRKDELKGAFSDTEINPEQKSTEQMAPELSDLLYPVARKNVTSFAWSLGFWIAPPRGIFGVPLNVSIKYANVAISLTNDHGESFIYGYVPIVVAKCGVFLKEKATDVEGIFRLNGSAKRIKDLQEVFDSPERYGKGLDWTGYTVHDAANVLRRYLNQLPEPIVPLEFYERFRDPLRIYQQQIKEGKEPSDADKFDHAKAVDTYQRLIIELPPLNKQLLLYILDLLAVFASKSDQNRMPSNNLSAIFQPGMLSHPNHDMSPDEYKLSQDVLIFLIENQDHFLFGMSGTAADEETMKEVEAGIPRPAHSTVRRSVSNASANTESHRKIGSIRRNVSVSSRNSRHSNTAQSPGTPTSITGGGVHRSNTLPSKMGPVLTSARYARANETPAANPGGLAVSHQSSRSTSRTPSVREEPEGSAPAPAAQQAPRPTSRPASQQASEPVQPVAEPVALPVAQPVVQPVAQPVALPVAQPVVQPVAQPVAQPVVQPVVQPVAQVAAQQVAQPVVQPATQPVAEPVTQPVAQPAVQNVVAQPIAQTTTEPAPAEPVAHNTTQSSQETPGESSSQQRNPPSTSFSATQGSAYVHTSTHGPLPPAAAERLSIAEPNRPHENLNTPIASPPQVVTPSRERKLSNFFTKSPPPEGEPREPRQPNRLRKKRIPGSASMSAQSSTTSLHAHGADSGAELQPSTEHHPDVIGDTTPRPPNTATLGNRRESASESTSALTEGTSQSHQDHSLRPNKSRTPSMNSRSSFTDQSDLDQPEDASRSDRHEHRRSWRFHRSSKRTSEQLGLGLSSPPLIATNPGAEQSTSSIGSGHHQISELASHPLSLDAGVQSTSSIPLEQEKKSLFGKFKAKVAQVRDGVKDERDRTKSPTRSDTDPSIASQPLSPIITDSMNGNQSTEAPREQAKEEPVRSPVSPFPGAGLPPPIPEEPHSPVLTTAAPVLEQKDPIPVPNTDSDKPADSVQPTDLAQTPESLPTTAPVAESVPVSEPTLSVEPPKEGVEPSKAV